MCVMMFPSKFMFVCKLENCLILFPNVLCHSKFINIIIIVRIFYFKILGFTRCFLTISKLTVLSELFWKVFGFDVSYGGF